MPRPGRLENLDDVKMWIADHDGRIDQLWANQLELNRRQETQINVLAQRLTLLEKRIVFVSGGAAAMGSLGGVLIMQIIGRL